MNKKYLGCGCIIILIFTSSLCFSQKVITLKKRNNSYTVQCRVNSIPMEFIFDTGATDVTISITEANFLIKQGLLKETDIKGKVKYSIANGDIEEGTQIILREINIEGIIIKNVEASVINNSKAPLLFGLNAIKKLGKVIIEDDKILIYPNSFILVEKPSPLFNITDLAEYDNQIKLNPLKALPYYNRGSAKFRRKDYLGALQDCDSAIKYDSKNADFFYKRGTIQNELKAFNEGINDFTSALLINPKFYEAFNARALLKNKILDYDGAMKDFELAIKIEPNSTFAYISRGSVKGGHDDIIGAIEDYSKALAIDSLCADAYVKRGFVKNQIYDFRGAIQDFSKAFGISPDDKQDMFSYAYNESGFAKRKLEDYRGAIIDFTKAMALNPSNVDFIMDRAITKEKLKDINGAIEDFLLIIEIDPKNSQAYYYMGVDKFLTGDNEGGCLDLSKAGELGEKKVYDLIKKYCK